MKAERTILIVLAIAVVAVFGFLAWETYGGRITHSDLLNNTPRRAEFAGHTVILPAGWQVQTSSTNGTSLVITHLSNAPVAPLITLEDQRRAPELVSEFVPAWKRTLGVAGFTPRSIEEFHDPAVDSVGAACVAITYNGTVRPLRIICLASDGRWKLTLSGEDTEKSALDGMAEQLPRFTATSTP